MGLATWFAGIAGGRRDLLASAPGDRIRYAAMGGVILTTATVAAASGAIAVNIALKLGPLWSVLVGLLWGLVIFNLDRLLVVQMSRPRSGIRQPILLALPRLLLAIILGFVISTPLVLRIFNAEITQELGVLHQQQYAAYITQIDNTTYKNIPTLTSQLNQAEQVKSSAPPSVDANPDVKAAEARFSAAEKAYVQAEQNVVCEVAGTCSDDKPGAGVVYKTKLGILNNARQELNADQTALNQIRAKVTQQLNNDYQNKLSSAQSTISADKAQLAKLQAQRTADLANQKKQINANTGLLARLEALSALSANQPTLNVTHWALFALFLAIEVLPVLTKLLQVLGPETLYDRLSDSSDTTARSIHQQSDDGRLKIHRSQQLIELKLERDRARRALAAGKKYNKKLAKTQQDVITAALDAWSQHANASTKQALADWQQQMASNSRPPSGPPMAITKPTNITVQPPGPVSPLNGHLNGQTGPFRGPLGPQPPTTQKVPQSQPTLRTQSTPQVQSVSQTAPVQSASDPVDPTSGQAYDPVSGQLSSDYEPAHQVYPPADPAPAEIGIRNAEPEAAPVVDVTRDEPQQLYQPSGRHARDEIYDQEADPEQVHDEVYDQEANPEQAHEEAMLPVQPDDQTYREPPPLPDEEDR